MEDDANTRVITAGSRKVIAGTPNAPLLRTADDVVELIGLCMEHSARAVLLHDENMPEHFFDLSSGEAGAILQKLRNYHIRLALVAPDGSVLMTGKFREMALEEGRGSDFRLFEDEASAVFWLAGGS